MSNSLREVFEGNKKSAVAAPVQNSGSYSRVLTYDVLLFRTYKISLKMRHSKGNKYYFNTLSYSAYNPAAQTNNPYHQAQGLMVDHKKEEGMSKIESTIVELSDMFGTMGTLIQGF